MNLLGAFVSGGVGSLLSGIGDLAKGIRSAVTGKLPPEEEAKFQMQLMELEFASQKAQTEINLAEAQHPSVFVAGWRPAIGWVCALGLAYQFLVNPTLVWAVAVFGSTVQPPALATEGLMTLVMSLLGLGGMRTYEKVREVNRRH
jgi:hypothetical protein